MKISPEELVYIMELLEQKASIENAKAASQSASDMEKLKREIKQKDVLIASYRKRLEELEAQIGGGLK